MENECCGKKKWCKILTIVGIIALIAGLAYAVYYFFFADDYEDLDEDFFEDDDADLLADGEEKKEESDTDLT